MRSYLQVFISSLMSGFMITIGATVYIYLLSMNQKLQGAFLFGFGLFIIIHFELWLYTGKVGNLLDNKPKYLLKLLVCVIGNMLGVFILSSLLKTTRAITPLFIDTASNIVASKQNDNWWSILFLSFMCGIMIYLAVKGHQKCSYSIGKALIAFLAIVVFIICGFEHCVANVAYYTYAGIFTPITIIYFILMIIGNGLGAIFFDAMIKLINNLKEMDKGTN